MRISIVVSTYNRPETLRQVLAGLARQSLAPHEVIIADDGSGPATQEMLAAPMPGLVVPVRHLWHPDQGFRKTVILNQAVLESTGEYLVFTDGDCVPHPRFVADHAALAEEGFWVQGRRCFVREAWVPRIRSGRIPFWAWWMLGRIHGGTKGVRLPVPLVFRDRALRGIIGCNLAAWRDDLAAVNGFDEDYIGWGIGEDSDLGVRLYHLGRRRKIVYGRAIVYHLDHAPAPKAHVAASLARLDEVIRERRVRCGHGLNRHSARPLR